MRYRAASAYALENNDIYLVSLSDGYNNSELAGLQLCDSPKGTGVNAPDHNPYPRYGAAAAGRGNCKHQVCINDKYH